MTTGSELAELVGGFTVTPGQPTLFSVSPNSAMQGTSLTVVLGGAFTNFTPQLTTAFFGSGISVGTVTVNGPTLASVPITIAPGATVGARNDHGHDRQRGRRPDQRVHRHPGHADGGINRSECRPARGDAERHHHWRVHELADGRDHGELRGWRHRELERRELGDVDHDEHHHRCRGRARPSRRDRDDGDGVADRCRRLRSHRRRHDRANAPAPEPWLGFDRHPAEHRQHL